MADPMTLRLAATLALSLSAVARSQPIADDFESNSLSGWVLEQHANITIAPHPAAAHRGSYGVRVVDTEMVLEDTPGATAVKMLQTSSTSVYSRIWFRIVSTHPSGGGTGFFDVAWNRGPAYGTAHTCMYDYRSEVFCGAQDIDVSGNVGYDITDAGVLAADGGWHLYEGMTLGRMTDAGVMQFDIDGVIGVRKENLHAAADRYALLRFGEVYNYNPIFTAVLDFDDVRLDVKPMASRVELRAPAPLVEQACSALEVWLSTSLPAVDGGRALGLVAPYPLAVHVGGATVFSDPACTTAATSPLLDGGSATLTLYVRPAAAGPLALTVAHVEADLLPGAATFTVDAADAGPPDAGDSGDAGTTEASYYALRCAVAPAQAGLALGFALLLPRRRRRVTSARTS